MNDRLVERIKSNPKYQELISKRSSFSIKLAIFMLVVYYGFIGTIAFDKEFFATKISNDSIITVALPIGAAIIIIAFITTVIYVIKANGEFENLTNEIKNDVKDIL